MKIYAIGALAVAPLLAGAQVLDSTYWKGWIDTPVDVVRVDQWSSAGWWTAAGITAGGVLLYQFDEDIRDVAQDMRTPESDAVSTYGVEPIGSGYYSLTGTVLIGGIAALAGDERLQRTSAQAVKAWLITGGATVLIKQLAHRSRPNESEASDHWYGPYAFTSQNTAFISGHTSSAFALASVFAHSYPDHPWVGITTYSLAGLAGLSRMNDNRHWASDVFLGAALGWYVGRVIVQNDSRLQVVAGTNGVSMSWSLDPH